MAHIEEGGSGRQANVEVNIVPFIDLMSVLVIFLLITAVWSQVSMIQIGSSVYGQKSEDESVKPPDRIEIPFRVDVKTSGYRVQVGPQSTVIPKVGEEYDTARLLTEVKKVKEIYPDKTDVVITVADSLPYKTLIGGMDVLLQAGFPQIAVTSEVQ
ncbi:MAG: biopolymer transporter ExbD [Pseudobdellovibrionaceae bacterium]|nr:biopolymer transporter ExbD [Bdellovibrionales bacterium]USN47430.1 MAG: biopolymer transporter ExbD [Pseudobdellovibrionaceae bacterium]